MEPEKNLHASIPPALLAEMQRTAQAEHITLDELMREAVKRYIEERSWNAVYAYGQDNARKLGLKEEDVERVIHEFREEERQRQNAANKR